MYLNQNPFSQTRSARNFRLWKGQLHARCGVCVCADMYVIWKAAGALTDGSLDRLQSPLAQGPGHLSPGVCLDIAGEIPVLLHALDVDRQLNLAGVAAQLLLDLVHSHTEAVKSLGVVEEVKTSLGLPLHCASQRQFMSHVRTYVHMYVYGHRDQPWPISVRRSTKIQ
jgi:hypothetical protein